ncbi:hypothetical protein AVEN_246837-1 [Araneus ventricosus]|uniref:Uncharacterized protein n=1 Tax=Araneus ventricosus TaxID=182803 RepID=A0A4Y2UTD6_ARAVE|nr:hypothetical protein AVEN_246837-1 [Araneus ventricosus]
MPSKTHRHPSLSGSRPHVEFFDYMAQLFIEAPKSSSVDAQQCVPPAINEFPEDIFTQEQRQSGFVAIHFVATIYLCLVLAIICDQFFVPTLEIIAECKFRDSVFKMHNAIISGEGSETGGFKNTTIGKSYFSQQT